MLSKTKIYMKTAIIFLLSSLIWVGMSCKNDNEKLLNTIAGTWQVDKVIYKSTDNKPDSTINCINCVLQFDKCELGRGGCGGFYVLMDGQKVNIVHSPSGKTQTLSISVVGTPARPTYNLIGVYNIENRSNNSMTLIGPILYKSSSGLSSIDAEIKLKK